MGFFKKLFSGKEPSDKERDQKRDANNFDTLKYNGIQALQMGKSGHAIAYLTHALDLREDEEAHMMLMNAFIRDNDLESAAEVAKELCEQYPGQVSHPINLAQLLFQLERYDEMGSACAQAIAIDSTRATPHHQLAEKGLATGDYANAEAEATKTIEMDSEFFDSYLLRARIFQQEKKYTEALADLEHLRETGHVNDDVLLLRGELQEATGQQKEALESYEEVLSENPFSRNAYAKIALLQIQFEQYEEAEETIKDAIDQNGEFSQIIIARQGLKTAIGDTDGAAEDAELAEKLKAEEEVAEHKEANLEQEMKEKYNSINPFQ